MVMAEHPIDGGGAIVLKGMFSGEPFTSPNGGFPELFQTGETWRKKSRSSTRSILTTCLWSCRLPLLCRWLNTPQYTATADLSQSRHLGQWLSCIEHQHPRHQPRRSGIIGRSRHISFGAGLDPFVLTRPVVEPGPRFNQAFRVGAFTFGGVRDVIAARKLRVGLGADIVVYHVARPLEQIYGSPTSAQIWVRLKPGRMEH
jgi:hypothetical protein